MSTDIPIIPQNNNENFIIYKNVYFNSVDIQFNHITYINIQNLFLFIKSYVDNDELLIDYILIISDDNVNKEDYISISQSLSIFHYIKTKKIKKMSFFDFKEWFEDLKENDYEYIKNCKYYGFRIVFNKNSIFYKKNEVYPLYPWNKSYKNIYIKQQKKNKSLEKWLLINNRFLYIKWLNFKNQSK
jgi:hypothetical protein